MAQSKREPLNRTNRAECANAARNLYRGGRTRYQVSVPRCYLLSLCSGSSLDQHSNNVSLFNLVEQINIQPGAAPAPGTMVPLEVHAYFHFAPNELGFTFEVRYVLVSMGTGLESSSDIYNYRSMTPRYRTRTLGLPFPPVSGNYELRLDWRASESKSWSREALCWPIAIVEAAPQQARVTH